MIYHQSSFPNYCSNEANVTIVKNIWMFAAWACIIKVTVAEKTSASFQMDIRDICFEMRSTSDIMMFNARALQNINTK